MQKIALPKNRAELLALAEHHYNPDLVAINQAAIEAADFPKGELQLMRSGLVGNPHFDADPVLTVAFLLALNAVNHRFWTPPVDGILGRYSYDGKVGAMGWRTAYQKSWGEKPSLDNFRSATASVVEMRLNFGELPDMAGRYAIYQEMLAGSALMHEAEQLVTHFEAGHPVTVDMAAKLAECFPRAFADPFLKKPQLALAEIAGHFVEAWKTKFEVLLTAFADYQVPRVMRGKDIVVYSPEVARLVDNLILIPEGSPIEMAIRSATLKGCAKMAAYFEEPDAAIDNFAFLLRKQDFGHFHLTLTNHY